MHTNKLPIYFSIAIVFGVLIGAFFNGGNGLSFTKNSSNEEKIKRLIHFIEKDYVDNVNTDGILDEAITQMLGKLDPHSVYIPKENLQAITENMQGNFVGIGIQFRMIGDTITVMEPIKGGPSIKAGIQSGDRILIANKDTLFGKSLASGAVPSYLKGKAGTKVALEVHRKSNDSLFTVDITRGKVNIKSVDIAYMLNDSLGYIKLDRFARNTYKEFKSSLDELLEKGMKNLVLDLRGNGGGFIDIANKIVDEFLEADKLIVFTKNNKEKIVNAYTTDKGSFKKGGLYILIDENSASASEIVAGALQDNDRGITLGRRSFGKGLVQEEMDLGDGSAVRLTTARYYTPTGRSIQKPYVKGEKKKYLNESLFRVQNGELTNKDSIPIIDSLQYKTPKGKVVYGGGGIIPDVFVPIDTTNYLSNYYFNRLNTFAFTYVDNRRKQLIKKWALDDFILNFDTNNTVFNEFLPKIKDANPSYLTQQSLQKYLKASIANEIFGDIGLYKILHIEDKMLQKVLELETSN